MQKIIFFFNLFISSVVFANNCKSDDQADFECCEFFKSVNNTKISRLETLDKSICTLSIYNVNADKSFRRFGFASDGQISIFMQPGGNKLKANSSQSYLIFPFGDYPTIKATGDERLHVRSGSGQNWTFNTQNSLPIALEGCNINVSSKFSLQDSGVKIVSCKKHLVIETPIEVGGEYIAYPDKTITVRDPNQKACQIRNSDLYDYKKSGSSYKDKLGRHFTMKMKFKSNKELGLGLQKICPKLDVSMMLTSSVSSPKHKDSNEEKRARDILEGQTKN